MDLPTGSHERLTPHALPGIWRQQLTVDSLSTVVYLYLW
jgi:hypothetical protein